MPQAALTLLLERLSFNQLEIDANVFQAIFDLATVIAGDQTLVSSDLSFIKQRLVLALSHSLDALAVGDFAIKS